MSATYGRGLATKNGYDFVNTVVSTCLFMNELPSNLPFGSSATVLHKLHRQESLSGE